MASDTRRAMARSNALNYYSDKGLVYGLAPFLLPTALPPGRLRRAELSAFHSLHDEA